MEKNRILSELNYYKALLSEQKTILKRLEEEYEALQEFSRNCNSHIEAFDMSMIKRKNRLRQFDGLAASVKSALRYKEKMKEMLEGNEYRAVVSSIEHLQNSVESQKRKNKSDWQYAEERITELEIKIDTLQEEYGNCLKEEMGNVEE